VGELTDALVRIAVALERIADQRDSVIVEADVLEASEIRYLTAGEIIDVVSAVVNVDILEKTRATPFVWGRYAAMTAMRERLRMTLPVIGRSLGHDHTSVLHGLVRFRDRSWWSTWDERRWTEINRLLDGTDQAEEVS
jgi:chromosomal replication initiation ATPase DnaA